MVRLEKCRPFLWAIILLLLVCAVGCSTTAVGPAKEEPAGYPVMLRMEEPMPEVSTGPRIIRLPGQQRCLPSWWRSEAADRSGLKSIIIRSLAILASCWNR